MAFNSTFTTRKEIRHKLVEILKGKTLAGEKVFANNVSPIEPDDLPAVFIYPKSEDYTIINKAFKRDDLGNPISLKRIDLDIIIEIICTNTSEETMSDQIDDIAEEIEDLIKYSDRLGKLVQDIGIDRSEATLSGEGQKPEGSWRLNYITSYFKEPK